MKRSVESRAARRFAGFLTAYAVAVMMMHAGHGGAYSTVRASDVSPLLIAPAAVLFFGPLLLVPSLLLFGVLAVLVSCRWAVWAFTLAITMTIAVYIGMNTPAKIDASRDAGGAGWGWSCRPDC